MQKRISVKQITAVLIIFITLGIIFGTYYLQNLPTTNRKIEEVLSDNIQYTFEVIVIESPNFAGRPSCQGLGAIIDTDNNDPQQVYKAIVSTFQDKGWSTSVNSQDSLTDVDVIIDTYVTKNNFNPFSPDVSGFIRIIDSSSVSATFYTNYKSDCV